MSQSWILVQVSEDTFSHMADDLKYIGYTTFRGSCSYEVPNEEDFFIVYSGFNSGNLFPLFIAKVNKEFAETEFKYFPTCKTNITELVDKTLVAKIWETIQNAPLLAAWN